MVSEVGGISYPTPLYQNVPIEQQFYIPQRYVIDDISLGKTTFVITEEPHDYVIGQQIRFIIPANFGSYQLNEVTGFVISIPSPDQLEINIDTSTNVNPFNSSADASVASPQILATGNINSGVVNTTGRVNTKTFIPGSFINVSPQ